MLSKLHIFNVLEDREVSKRRVVVTGLGLITPLGNDVESSWNNIVNGKSGIGPLENFDVSAYTTRIGG